MNEGGIQGDKLVAGQTLRRVWSRAGMAGLCFAESAQIPATSVGCLRHPSSLTQLNCRVPRLACATVYSALLDKPAVAPTRHLKSVRLQVGGDVHLPNPPGAIPR